MTIEAVGPGTGGDIGLAADGGAGESNEPEGFKPDPEEDDVVCGAAELGRGGERGASWDDISTHSASIGAQMSNFKKFHLRAKTDVSNLTGP